MPAITGKILLLPAPERTTDVVPMAHTDIAPGLKSQKQVAKLSL